MSVNRTLVQLKSSLSTGELMSGHYCVTEDHLVSDSSKVGRDFDLTVDLLVPVTAGRRKYV
jgi:hypothetical protein